MVADDAIRIIISSLKPMEGIMRIRFAVPAIAAAMTLSAALAVPISAAASDAIKHSSAAHAAVSADPEFSSLQLLESSISDLGENSYPTMYAGVQLSAGELDVYVASGDDSAFLAAVTALDTGNLPYTVKTATHDYATQAATSQWLASNYSSLQSEGITAGWWGPSAPDGAVQIAFQIPDSTQLTQLQATAAQVLSATTLAGLLPTGTAITQGTYMPVAAAVINTQLPAPDSVVAYPSLLDAGQEATGYNDTKPFNGADQIEYTLSNSEICTSNFSFNGANDPSNHWVFTAAHCSNYNAGHNFYTCATRSGSECNYNVGTVSKVYSSGQDFESIGGSNAGFVWNDSTGVLWSVNGYVDADQGMDVTVDGQTNGSHSDLAVTAGGGDTCVTYSGHLTCHAFVIDTGSAQRCVSGDSGGPVLIRESDGFHIKAAGMILAFSDTSDGHHYCYAQQVFRIRDQANVRLIFGS